MTLPPPLRRIRAMLYRHACLLLGSWPRLLDLVYWPTVQMVLWGFITLFLAGQSGWVAQAAGVFLSAVLLWDALFRGQLGVSLCFLEELYARHLGHLFVSPLRPAELVVANFLVSLVRVLIGVGGAALLAIPLFHFSLIGSLGWALLPFFAVLMLRQGRLVDQGSPGDLLARYGRDDLEDVFLDIARQRRQPAPA